jgi:hypothetical protein
MQLNRLLIALSALLVPALQALEYEVQADNELVTAARVVVD